MCYFDGIPCVRDVVLPRRKAMRAWKGFDWGLAKQLQSPWYYDLWKVGKRREATEHGFYAVHTKPEPFAWEAGNAASVRRVLVWGRVREYKGYGKHGYRAQYCMVLPVKRTAKRQKGA